MIHRLEKKFCRGLVERTKLKRVIADPARYGILAIVAILAGLAVAVRAKDAPKDGAPRSRFEYLGDLEGSYRDALAFSGDGTRFVTARKKRYQVWDLATCKLVSVVENAPLICREPQLTFDGKLLFAYTNDEARLWDVQTWRLQSVTRCSDLSFARISPDGTRILLRQNDDPFLQLWRPGDPKPVAELRQGRCIDFAAFNHRGNRLVTYSSTSENSYYLWDARTGSKTAEIHVDGPSWQTLPDHRWAAFDAGGKLVVSSPEGFCVMDVATGKILSTGKVTGDVSIEDIALSSDGSTVAATTIVSNLGQPKSVLIFDAVTGKLKQNLGNGEFSCQISPDAKWLFCNNRSGMAELWDLQNGLEAQTFPTLGDLGPDGKIIVLDNDDKQSKHYGNTSVWRFHEK